MQSLRVPTGLTVGDIENLHLAVSWLPPDATQSDVVFVCLPGGGMRREFFDLPAGPEHEFSFVAAMRKHGHGCLLVDHPGVGDSDQPADGFALTPAVLAEAHHRALQHLLQELPELAKARRFGLGHSMGAMITLIQQAVHASHAGIILLGFGFDGLPAYLPPAAKALLDDRPALEAASADLARSMFVQAYPVIKNTERGVYGGSNSLAGASDAIKAVSTHLLAVPAFMSMYPHHWDAYAAKIKVPVLLALGDKDLVRATDNVDSVFAASDAVEQMVLPETGHSQFVFASRTQLFAKIDQWVGSPKDLGER